MKIDDTMTARNFLTLNSRLIALFFFPLSFPLKKRSFWYEHFSHVLLTSETYAYSSLPAFYISLLPTIQDCFFSNQKIKSEFFSWGILESDSATIKERPSVKCKILSSQLQGHFSSLRLTYTSQKKKVLALWDKQGSRD